MIFKKAMELKDYMTKARRYLHENPELGLEEHGTTRYIKKELLDMGIELQEIDMETGAIGLIKGEKPGKDICIAIRADIDALPIEEKTGVLYASKNPGLMHACGHDGHTAILLGTAKLLNTIRNEFSGIVKLVFQPAEEGRGGAKKMVEAGAMDNPRPDVIIALHGNSYLNAGEMGINERFSSASSDSFEITVKGKGGHGARPHKAVNPVLCAAHIVTALQNIVSTEIDALESAVVTVASIHGGTASNVIADDVKLSGTVRCLQEKNRDFIKEKIERIVKGISMAQNCNYEMNYRNGVGALENDPDTVKELLQAVTDAWGENGKIVELEGPSMGSEDFPALSAVVGKCAYFRLGVGQEGKEIIDVHNERFDFNDDALPYGASVFTQYVVNKSK